MHLVSHPWRTTVAKKLFLGSLLIFVLISIALVIGGPVARFDGMVEHAVITNLMQTLSPLASIGGFLGGSGFLLPAAIILALLLVWKREWVLGIACIVSTLIAGTLVGILKPIFGRPRPIDVETMKLKSKFSFPSGHATRSAALYGFVIVLVWMLPISRQGKIDATVALIALILAIDAARMVAGVHYLTDVIAGNALGTAVLLGTLFLTDIVTKRIEKSHHR